MNGSSREGFDAEWREVFLLTTEGESINRCELFDEADLDAAITRFEQLSDHPQRVENAATRVYEHFWSFFAARDWNAAAGIVSESLTGADHRRVVNAGDRGSRETVIEDLHVAADLGFAIWMVDVVAVRGQRLALTRVRACGRDPETVQNDAFNIVEIDADQRIVSIVVFDLDDTEAAFDDLDARYLVGEAASCAATWSAITRSYTSINRGGPPVTTPNWFNIDHRQGSSFPPGGLPALLALWKPSTGLRNFSYIEVAHRLSNLGAVIGSVSQEISDEGVDAEWRTVDVFTVDGSLIDRLEVFDEADIDAALARFDELHPTVRRLENAASKVADQFLAHFAARDWSGLSEALADNFCSDDRRRVVGAGVRHGRDAQMADIRSIADVGTTRITSKPIALRGQRLVLTRGQLTFRDQGADAYFTESFSIVEVDAEDRIVALVSFDLGDIDAAYEELERRYLAGEAAPYARVWQMGIDTLGEANRHQPGPMMGQIAYTDHRRVPFAPGDFAHAVEELWSLVPDARYRTTVAHALDTHGIVSGLVIEGSDKHGNELQWARTLLFVADGPRMEVYEEDDVDAALARFEELRPPARRLENAATRMDKRFVENLGQRNWPAVANTLAADSSVEDRRHVVNAGIWHGRDEVVEKMKALAVDGGANTTLTVIAIRGERLALTRFCSSNRELRHGEFGVELLSITEIDSDERISARVAFDPDDIDSAFAELDARYHAGEAAPQSRTWSAITRVFEVLNRGELPTTTQTFEDVDHRRGVMLAPGDLMEFLHAAMVDTKQSIVYVEAIHRLTGRGAVVTHVAQSTTPDGFYAEWRMADVFMVEGDLINRYEFFEETDLDAALARFEELQAPTRQLENEATRVAKRFPVYMTTRDWEGMADILAADVSIEDRRPGANAGIRRGRRNSIDDMRAAVEVGFRHITSKVVATRGNDLALMLVHASGSEPQDPDAFQLDIYHVVEIDSERRTKAVAVFDVDAVEAAFDELDSRYLAGEAAAHPHTWSAITDAYGALNRGDIPPTTADFADIDHRSGATMAPGDLIDYLHVAFDETENNSLRIVAVYRLTDHGAVVTHVANGTTPEGLDVEWRVTNVIIIDGNLLNRVEMFDESDLDAALARFDELARPAPPLENDATKALAQFAAAFNRHDMAGMLALASVEGRVDDRREGLRAVLEVRAWPTAAESMFETVPSSWRMEHEAIAVRGSRLSLSRERYRDIDQADRPVVVELLRLVDLAGDDLLHDTVVFDSDDMAAAFAELDARYLAGEGAVHAHTWSIVVEGYAALNRGEMPLSTNDFVDVDHRHLTTIGPGDLMPYLRAALADSVGNRLDILAVHRLTELGAVVTHVAKGTSREGFYAEWRMTSLYTVAGDLINHCEMFDESDLDAALARFDELAR
ncbi:regulator [Mycobacterium ahvazicum]|uniref:Regulator n=1 Tax=Mycobacterium ahvazicum TaxID=1964395 RepID=A0A2K4YDP4_9MYCO|nr:regulator [Mycobacterium ahvazicum]